MRATCALCMPPGRPGAPSAAHAAACASGMDSLAALCNFADRAALFQRSAIANLGGAAGDFLAGARAFCRSTMALGSGHSVSRQQLVARLRNSASATTVSEDTRDGCAAVRVFQAG